MKLTESIDPKGRITLQMRDAQGAMVQEVAADNSIVLTGRDLVAKQFAGQSIASVSHVAIGTGNAPTDPNVSSALGTELFRKAINPINPALHIATTNDNKKKVTISCDLDFNEGNGALTEAGLFNAVTGGVMYNRVVFPPVNKTTDFKLTIIWEITF
jgi:YD repeat-containing protein